MAAVDQNSNAVLQGLARHVNCLGEENKLSRRRALESIKKDTIDRNPPLDESDLRSIYSELQKPLLKSFLDSVEKCRDIAISAVKGFLRRIPNPEERLPFIMPVLVQRLGQPEMVEPSEEIRFRLVELLLQLLEYSGKNSGPYVDDVVKILQKTIIDPFAEVKKCSCKCASILGKSVPEYFHTQSESLIKPLLMSISHQHSKVRTIVIETIGDVIQYGNGKSVDIVVSHLAQRLFDQSPAVRMAVTKVVGNWLLDLMDRYSFFNKLMPLLLTSITDELPEIRDVADCLWNDVGLKYQNENEDDLKDKMDFGKPAQIHYPPNVERPNLGCRTLMMRNVSKILPGLMRDVCDWVTDTRVKSASLLYTLLLNTEDYLTQHMEILTSGMYRACTDEDSRVVTDIQRSAELIGYFVEVEVWSKLILKNIKMTQSFSGVMVLAGVLRGSNRPTLQPYLKQICETITLPEVCQSVQVQTQIQLLACVEALLSVAKEDILEQSHTIFSLLHTMLALSQGDAISDKAHELLGQLANLHGLSDRRELYKTHTKPLIDSFQDSYPVWTLHSTERLVFNVLLIEAGPVVGEMLDAVIPILVKNLHPDKDPEVRLKFFNLLSALMMNSKDTLDSKDLFSDFALILVQDMVLPNCVWKAGRVAGAVRTTAVSCAWALMQSGILTKEKLEPIIEDFVTQMLSSMEDDNKTTRLVACRVMTRIFELMGSSIRQDRLHNMYLELLKRLDDSSDEIRITVAKTFLAYLECFQECYDVGLYRAHLEAMYKGLMVHLDDPEEKIQQAILNVLKRAGQLMPGMLIQEVETAKHKHRSKKFCDELVSHLQKLSAST